MHLNLHGFPRLGIVPDRNFVGRRPRHGGRSGRRALGRFAAAAAAALVFACSSQRLAPPRQVDPSAGAARARQVAGLELLGEAQLAPGLTFRKTVVGGLSGITYDAGRDCYYAVSDDPSSRSPARFYTLRIDLGSDSLAADGVEIEAVTTLRDRAGRSFERLVMDAESIVLTPHGTLLISAEGNIRKNVMPSLREFDLDGRELRELRIPSRYLPRSDRPFGVRHNQAFEALAWAASGGALYLAPENALRQDGPAADLGQGSPTRMLRLGYGSGKVVAERLYFIEPVIEPPADADGFRTNGLVELLDLGGGEMLALERSFSRGAGNSVRLFNLSTRGATDVRKLRRLDGRKAAAVRPVGKRLLLDLGSLGLELDNLEGMTFGPPLADGRRSLVLISDDNFNPAQKTQVLAFAVLATAGDGNGPPAGPQTVDPASS
jgi:hypothetical protein